MARKRTIDPAIWVDEAFTSLSLGARILYVGLVTQADDEGRLSGSALELKLRIFPADGFELSKIEEWRSELNQSRLIRCYTIGGKCYLTIIGWGKHQNVRWSSPSKIPAPPETSVDSHHENEQTYAPCTPRTRGVHSHLSHLSVVDDGTSTVPVVGGGPGEVPPPAAVAPPPPPPKPEPKPYPESVRRLWSVYLEATGRKPQPLGSEEAARLADMIGWAGSAEAAEAGIRKVGASEFHRGHNPAGKRHDGLMRGRPFATAAQFRGWCEPPAESPAFNLAAVRETPAQRAAREEADRVFGVRADGTPIAPTSGGVA